MAPECIKEEILPKKSNFKNFMFLAQYLANLKFFKLAKHLNNNIHQYFRSEYGAVLIKRTRICAYSSVPATQNHFVPWRKKLIRSSKASKSSFIGLLMTIYYYFLSIIFVRLLFSSTILFYTKQIKILKVKMKINIFSPKCIKSSH